MTHTPDASKENSPHNREELAFAPSDSLTLGVEVEVQLIDWKTHNLCPASPKILDRLAQDEEHIKPEIFQSMIELNTGICRTVAAVREDLSEAFARLRRIADPLGVELAVAGTHPFARYDQRVVYPIPRYLTLFEHRQWFARRLNIFGLHVHVGMRDGDHAIAMMNAITPYLGWLLALSGSSPFLEGDDTGLSSSRTAIFESMPNSGMPILVSDWAHFVRLHDTLFRAGSIRSHKDLWWDLRPSPAFGTLEIRICDGFSTLGETTACVALVQCLLSWLDQQHQDGRRSAPPPMWLYRENKWRAARYGMKAEFITDDQGHTRPFRALLEELLVTLEPIAAQLQCSEELRYVASMPEVGSSAERQRRVATQTHALGAVVDTLVQELRSGERIC